MFKRSSFVLGLIISLMAVAHGMDETGAPEVWYCRMADGAAHTSCGLPYELVREGLPEGLFALVFAWLSYSGCMPGTGQVWGVRYRDERGGLCDGGVRSAPRS